MGVIQNFEDIDSWIAGKELYVSLNRLISENSIRKEYFFRDQILRAALSITNNIAEGFERGGDKEFRRYLIISNGSASEVKSMLIIIKEVYPEIKVSRIEELLTLAQKCININKSLIRYLNSKIA